MYTKLQSCAVEKPVNEKHVSNDQTCTKYIHGKLIYTDQSGSQTILVYIQTLALRLTGRHEDRDAVSADCSQHCSSILIGVVTGVMTPVKIAGLVLAIDQPISR